MSDTPTLIVLIAVAEACLIIGVYAVLRLIHLRKYRSTRMRLSAARRVDEGERAVKRLRLLAILDTMVERTDRLLLGLAGSAPRPDRLALPADKGRKGSKGSRRRK